MRSRGHLVGMTGTVMLAIVLCAAAVTRPRDAMPTVWGVFIAVLLMCIGGTIVHIGARRHDKRPDEDP